MSLFEEIKRRNVFRVGIAYLVMGWIIIQVVDVVFPQLGFPDWTSTFITVLLLIGFPLALFLAWAFEMTPEGVKKTEDVDRDASVTKSTGHKLDRVIIATLVVALGYFVWERQQTPGETGPTAVKEESAPVAAATTTPTPAATPAKSIAVLPFVNMSSDPEQEYFSDGISEELLNALAKLPGLKVAARTSSFQFKDKNQDIQLIGRQLGVTTVLEGSVRKSGTRLRITAQLIDAENGFHIWSETYDRELTDIFAIQDEISKAIVDALKITLELGGDQKLLDAGTNNLEAYNAFLRGRYLFHRRGGGLLQAGTRFEEAITFDDQYANAYANLALTFSVGWGIRDVTKARPAARRAVELDPNSSLAWTAQAMVLNQFDWDFKGSMAAYEKAIELDANNADAYHPLALSHFDFGRAEKAIELEKMAIARDPAAFIYRFWLSLMYRAQGNFEKALDELRAVIELRPGFAGGHAVSALVLLRLGRTEEAEAAIREAERVAPTALAALSARAGFLFAGGHKEQAAKLARQALALPGAMRIDTVVKIANALITGDAQLSNHLIEEAFRLRHGFVMNYRHPLSDIDHETLAKTRFWELMREHGLMVDEDG